MANLRTLEPGITAFSAAEVRVVRTVLKALWVGQARITTALPAFSETRLPPAFPSRLCLHASCVLPLSRHFIQKLCGAERCTLCATPLPWAMRQLMPWIHPCSRP